MGGGKDCSLLALGLDLGQYQPQHLPHTNDRLRLQNTPVRSGLTRDPSFPICKMRGQRHHLSFLSVYMWVGVAVQVHAHTRDGGGAQTTTSGVNVHLV